MSLPFCSCLNSVMCAYFSASNETLLEEPHDLVKYTVEGINGLVTCFNHVTILGGMLVEERKPLGIILVNQYCTVTAATSPRGGTRDIGWHVADSSILALEHVGSGKQTGQ